MAVQIIDCEQNSEPWLRARLGIPTASMFATVMAKGKDGGASITRRTYMLKLVGERLTGEPSENYSNDNMARGHQMEEEARNLYAFQANVELTRVGFVINGIKGCSPDSLIGNNGIAEFKTAFPHILIDKLLRDEFPAEHKAQCQGALWVCEREWIDIAVYWPGLPIFIKRALRDEGFIANLAGAVNKFNDELNEMVERVRRIGGFAAEKAA